MNIKHPPLNDKLPVFWHGADYNPDQWPRDIWPDDIEKMKKAGCNVMTLAVFSWAHLEPQEGRYEFGWLDDTMNMLYDAGIYTILATPSAAPPAWLAEKYPEILREAW